MNNTIRNKPEMIDFVGIRIRHFTTISFDQVLVELRTRVGETFTKNVEQLNIDTETREELRRGWKSTSVPAASCFSPKLTMGVGFKNSG